MRFIDPRGVSRQVKRPYDYAINWGDSSLSKFQWEVKQFLFPFWKYDMVYEEFPVVGTRLRIDFFNYSKNIAVEVQGKQHTTFVKHFHGQKNNFVKQLSRDGTKLAFCAANDITLVEIFPKEDFMQKFLERGVELR